MANQANFIIQKPTLNFTVQRPTLSFIKPTIINYYGGVWGSITGTLLNQADLQATFNLKEDKTNKSDSYTASSSITYTSTKALVDGLTTKQNIITNSDSIVQGSTNLFLSAGERVKLANTSGVNTGDQDLSSYATTSALTAGLATKENSIIAGTTGQYWRGDKTFQTLDKIAIGLANVDNTSDLNKSISIATLAALNLKANTSSLATVATSGSYLDLINKPTIPSIAGLLVATNNLSDLNNIITAKTNLGLSTVATSGSYTDLSNKPTIPSITNLVPYTGATSNVNLGVYTIIAGNLSGSNSGDVSIGTSNGLSLIGQILSLQNASSIAPGALSSADWNTFNSKQNTIVNSDSITQGITNLFLTTAERTKLSNTSNTNTGDETTATIQTKLGTASATTSGYLLNTDWNTFNNKQNALGFTAENIANKSTSTILGSSDTLYPTQNAVKTYADGLVLGALNYRGGYDASTNLYPTTGGTGISGAVKKGNLWVISVAGILGGQAIQVGDSVIANIDTPGQTSSNWNTLNNNITYVPEDQANKSDSYLASSSTTYASTKALVDGLATKQATLIFGTGLTNTAGTISVNNSQSISVLTNLTTLGIVKTTASGILSSSLIANADITNGAIDLTLKVTGILPTANGGTGLSTIGTTGQVLAVNVAGTGLQYISIPSAPVSSVFGRVGVVVAANGDYTTSQVTEGTNFYYTQARFDTAFGAKTTTNLAEGTNLYYTDTRARNAVSVFGTPLTYNSTTGVFGINQANATTSGFLSSTDWNTFNNKQTNLGYLPLNPANNLSEVIPATARTNLGLVIGTNIQAYSANTTLLGNTTTGTGNIVLATSPTLVTPKINTVLDVNGNIIVGTIVSTSAVNYVGLQNNGAGFAPRIYAAGTDSNISLNLITKGTGNVLINSIQVPTISSTNTFTNKTLDNTNIATFKTNSFTLQDLADTTKQAIFSLSGLTTGTTRTYTLPDTSGVLAFLSQTNKLVVSVGKAGSNANFITSSYATEDLAFQAAFDSIASTGGIVRALGANVTYTWANSVKQYNNTILEGEGFGTIIQAANSFIAVTPTGMRPFMLYNNSSTAIGQNPFTYIDYNIGVRDITFDGNPTGQSGRLGATGFQFVTNVFVLRVKTQNCGATYFGTGTDKETQGIFFRNCKNPYIKDSIDFATDGFTLSYYENALIDNCSGENGTSEFIFLGSGKKGAANNCRALNYAGYGFLVTGNGDIVNKPVSDSGFINCIASGCGNSGALGYYDGFSVTEGYRNFVINCTSYNNQRNGILLSNAYQTRIIGNTIYNNSQQLAGTYSGIVIQGTDGYNIITNNNSYDDQATPTQKFGIYETGTQTSNYIYNNFGTGNITSFISQLSFTALNEAIQLSNPRVSGIILDPNGKNSIGIESTANAVNYVAFKNNAAGNAPQIIARGTDANISLKFITKGTGASVFSPAIEIQDNTTFSQRGQINTSLITAGNLRVFNLPDLSGVIALTSQITGTNSGVNTGDETTATIQTKLGVATTSTSGYLTLTDWNTFNNKQTNLGYLPLNPANNLSEVIPATARTNLGLVIGTNIQAYSANTTLLGNTVTGSGSIVLATSPTLITPILGIATATTINKVTFSAPATGSTLTILDGFTLTVNANATVAGTNTGDQTTITGNAGTATTLQTARAINGVSFNGSADITIADSTKLAKAGDTITGDIANTATGYFRLPNGTTLQRPGTPTTGMVRFNTDTGRHEFYAASTWLNHARLSGDTFTGAIFATNLSGTNTGDQTITLTGDIAGSGIGSFATTLATVNSNVGLFTYASLTVNAKGLITAASSGITPEVPLTFSTGLTRTINTITVNTSQNIATLSNLVTNGFVKASGGTGTLSVDTNTYIVTGGNAGSATVLQTARTINSISFDGSTNIIVADSTKLPLSGGTLTGRLIGNASTTAGSTINIPAGIAPTTPVEGDVWNDSTQKAQTTFTDGINQKLVGCVFTQTVNTAAVVNTTTLTTVIGSGIGTLTLPANFFVVGKTVRITWYGIVSTTGTPTLLMVGFLGASNIAGTNATTLGTLTFVGIKAELLITCRSVGATGTVRAQTMFMASGNVIGVSGAGNTTIDTTVSQTIDLRAQWGTASASNTLTGVNAMVEILN